MNIHEYQAKEILRKYNVAVPRGKVAFTAEEALAAAQELGGKIFVVKAQIHAGGRGKAGGVKIAKSLNEAKELASKMIGMKLVTHQTGPEGKEVRRVLIEEGIDIARELYLGIVLDRSVSRLVFMASTEGGVEIEKIATEKPEAILKEYVDPKIGLQPFQARKIAFGLGLEGNQVKNAVKFITSLYRAFTESDASLAEINPLVVTADGKVLALQK
jgi:succinyl-CoA synthetase beta subunit